MRKNPPHPHYRYEDQYEEVVSLPISPKRAVPVGDKTIKVEKLPEKIKTLGSVHYVLDYVSHGGSIPKKMEFKRKPFQHKITTHVV